jgi:hypothetical protein
MKERTQEERENRQLFVETGDRLRENIQIEKAKTYMQKKNRLRGWVEVRKGVEIHVGRSSSQSTGAYRSTAVRKEKHTHGEIWDKKRRSLKRSCLERELAIQNLTKIDRMRMKLRLEQKRTYTLIFRDTGKDA